MARNLGASSGSLSPFDPHRHAVFIREDQDAPEGFKEKSYEISGFLDSGVGRIKIRFKGGQIDYAYGRRRVYSGHLGEESPVPPDTLAVLDDKVLDKVTSVYEFEGPCRRYFRILYTDAQDREAFATTPIDRVRFVAKTWRLSENLEYLNRVLVGLGREDPLSLNAPLGAAPETALARYLSRAPTGRQQWRSPTIYPFRCNLSQRAAVRNALTSRLSVIHGPPGTGKTQTILNIIANIVAFTQDSVAVVSLNNAAVENILNKLVESELDFMVASLGRKEKRARFFESNSQNARNGAVDAFLVDHGTPKVSEVEYARLDDWMEEYLNTEREIAVLTEALRETRLEKKHFEAHLEPHRLPPIGPRRLAQSSSDLLVTYLAQLEIETQMRPRHMLEDIFRKVRRYFKYGSTRDLGPDDVDAALRVQQMFYDRRIAELEAQLVRARERLDTTDLTSLSSTHQEFSLQLLRQRLRRRYAGLERQIYAGLPSTVERAATFTADYPVLLSTCHSLRPSLPAERWVDYLIIDEASQVDVLTAAVALDCARRVIIVGDQKQLTPVEGEGRRDLPLPPDDSLRCSHSILGSVLDAYGDDVPQQLLVEHYRCDPAIIGFCNRMYYDEKLIPFRPAAGDGSSSMKVIRTEAGNHMRWHRGGGVSNQREVDVIAEEVLKSHIPETPSDRIGIASPYCRQTSKLWGSVDLPPEQISTVHKYQGRETEAFVLSTVVDEKARSRQLSFVDAPELINVAVSRAQRRFVLVTHRSMLPKSRNIRDLIAYICQQNLGAPADESAVVSVFDLLYREYSERLRDLQARIRGPSTFRSENLIWTLLDDILKEETFSHLGFYFQYRLSNLLSRDGLRRLNDRQRQFVRSTSSVDFLVFRKAGREPILGLEVDGFAFHENDEKQLARDRVKDEIFEICGLALLRLPTTGSGEAVKIREALTQVESNEAPNEQRLRAIP